MFKNTLKFAFIAILVSFNAFADTIHLDVGRQDQFNHKLVQIGYQFVPLKNTSFDFLFVDGLVGSYMPHNLNGDKSYIFEGAIGAKVVIDCGLYVSVSQGISWMNHGFYYLDQGIYGKERTKMQLPTQLSAGLHHKNASLGLFWKHYSNGKSNYANSKGTEFLGLELGYTL